MNLGGNQLSGNIPENIGDLKILIYLNLENNQLMGEISDSIGNLTILQQLWLSDNQFSGHIPDSIKSLTQLSYFDENRYQSKNLSQFINQFPSSNLSQSIYHKQLIYQSKALILYFGKRKKVYVKFCVHFWKRNKLNTMFWNFEQTENMNSLNLDYLERKTQKFQIN